MTMRDRLLLLISGIACAIVAQLMWSHLTTLVITMLILGTVYQDWAEHRRHRSQMEERERAARRDERERLRQLGRLARTLAAVRDQQRR